MQSVNWLHLSDLHFGLDRQSWLWPGVKHEFFRDLEKVTTDIGCWDLIFFTGDLTQCGSWDQFSLLSKDLQELWTVLSKSGNTPKLCVVPGNHDLVRPSQGSAIAKAFTQLWSTDMELRRAFWSEKDCEYRDAVRSFFENFTKWTSDPPVPMLPIIPGVLPGDFSATFEKGGVKLGIIGLNSTFLQIAGGDFKGRLELHVSQLNQVCGGDPTLWLKDKTATILLTHQPPSWLAPDALHHFRQEIYLPGRFLTQLCGHQHEPEAFETVEAGAPPRRLRQAPSLFGMETWEGPTPEKRIHGYSAGKYIFDGSEGHEVLLPRIAVPGRHGGLNLAPDHSYVLQEDNSVVTPFELDAGAAEDDVSPEITSSGVATSEPAAPSAAASPIPAIPLLEPPLGESQARTRLTPAPRLGLNFGPQHRFIRQEEQSQFEHELRRTHCMWLVADWGTGKEDFLGSCIERFRVSGQPQDVFHIRCDDAMDPDSLEALFPQQVGMPLQTFCLLLASLKTPFLVLDGIHPQLCKSPGLQAVYRIAKAVTDYCTNLLLILASRLTPGELLVPTIELRPLEVTEVRTYLLHHPDAPQALHEADILERLHERTDGLPMHLDRIIRSLKVSSLESVLDAEMEGLSGPAPMEEIAPKALIHAVTSLANSQDKHSRRSFRLMQILSVLSYGETLDSLRHFLPAEPFFLENALQLHDLALLDVITLHQTAPNVSSTVAAEEAAPKLLKVPRQVRDYTQTLLNDNDRWAIVLAGLERFFGRKWLYGKIKLRSLPPEYKDYLTSGPGNEFALIHFVITHGRSTGDDALLRRGQWLAVQYARYLDTKERYRDLAAVAGGVLQLVQRDKFPKDWATLAGLTGAGLRMMGKDEEAIRYSKLALEDSDAALSKDEKAMLWVRVALSEERLGNKAAAIAAAEKVKENSMATSPLHAQAHLVILGLTLSPDEKLNQLPAFEKSCRNQGFQTVADNIALDLAAQTKEAPGKLKHLDRVLTSTGTNYNHVRAIVEKADAVARLDTPAKLEPEELTSLLAAYSYLHAQRFGSLFDQCHRALWQGFETKGETPQMLRLFRHSSFVWRIRGDDEKEATYITRLSEKNVRPQAPPNSSLVPIEFRYFMKRLKAVLTKPTPAAPQTPAPKGSSEGM